MNFIQDHCNTVNKCLDVGSSTGILLKAIREKYRCKVFGIEPGDAYREFSEKEEIPSVADLKELDRQHEKSFDLITMGHTLEHLPDPLSYLRTLKERWLKEGGHLLIEVPNLFGHTSFELAHLTAFSPQTLRSMLLQAGYEISKLHSHGSPRSKLIPLYITAIATGKAGRAEKSIFRTRPWWIRFRRRFGMQWNKQASRFLTRWARLPWPELE